MSSAYEPAAHHLHRRILVTGATGTTGRLVRAALGARGASDVVAASRRPDPRDPGPAVRFDWSDPATHDAALDGVGAAYLVPPPGATAPAEVMVPFLRRAVDAGVRRVVLLGAASVDAGAGGVGDVYGPVAELVPEWAVLRPSWFMQNVTGDHQQARSLRAEGVLRTATGDGRVPFVDARDIAEVAAVVLLADATPDAELVLTGPAALTYDEVAAVLTAVGGRPVRHERLGVGEMRDRVFADLPRDFAQVLAEMDAAIAGGAWSEVTADVARVTGRPPGSFAEFAERNRAGWSRS